MRENHTLTITVRPDGGYKYSTICPGVTYRCVVYDECGECSEIEREKLSVRAGRGETEYVYHGVDHTYMEGEWVVATDRCITSLIDPLDEGAGDIARLYGPGKYEVDIAYTWDSDEWTLVMGGDLYG